MFDAPYIYYQLDPELLAQNGAPLSLGFSTEIAGLVGLIFIFIYVMLTKAYWDKPAYTLSVFV